MKFYQEAFGWQPDRARWTWDRWQYQMFNRPHGMIGGMMNKPTAMAQRPAELADLLPRAGRRRRRRAHQGQRRQDAQRTDGGSRRRPCGHRRRSAGRRFRAALEEGVKRFAHLKAFVRARRNAFSDASMSAGSVTVVASRRMRGVA